MQTTYKVSDLYFDMPGIWLKLVETNSLESFMIGLHDKRLNYLLAEIIPQDVAMIEHLRSLDGDHTYGETN